MYKFLYIRTIEIPQLTAVHMHTESEMYFMSSFTVTNAEITYNTIAPLIKITYIAYNVPVINTS